MGGWVGGVEKLILKLTSASTGVEVEARAELGNYKLKTLLTTKDARIEILDKMILDSKNDT